MEPLEADGCSDGEGPREEGDVIAESTEAGCYLRVWKGYRL